MERRDPAAHNSFVNKEGRGEMTKAPVDLQDLRRKIYVKAKAEPSWRFWGLYVHVYKTGTLYEAYRLAKKNNGAPGIDGVTFEAIEALGVEQFVEQLRKELSERTYRPLRVRKVGIPKDGGKVRVLPPSRVCDPKASAASSFFSITESIPTTILAVNGYGFWNRSWKCRNTGFRVRWGVSGQ